MFDTAFFFDSLHFEMKENFAVLKNYQIIFLEDT